MAFALLTRQLICQMLSAMCSQFCFVRFGTL
jgi:hypothetical protein